MTSAILAPREKLFLLLAVFALSTTAFAEGNIRAGNAAVSGYADVSRRSAPSDATDYALGINSSYFFRDSLALGVKGTISGSSDSDMGALLGPTATYFFWSQDSLASYARAGIQFGLTDVSVLSIIQGELGLEHFLLPSVALGPVISYSHYNSRYSDFQRLGFSVNLAIYL
ncbi:MAG: hypothetical protein A2X94_06740 [Bdellovibrionales bacterium GWB1_55_8]|nr:MAG: hypothetical protein A2X94_06740 [Bdellovibrionales bacterium GWB1_55_8]